MDRATPDRPVPRKPRSAVPADDLRWLLITGAAFVVSLAVLAVLHWLYRATGPHPEMVMLLRRLRRYSRWLLPGI